MFPWHGIVGWTYDADMHCNSCAIAQFGESALFADDTRDSEGNPLHPIFSWSERNDDDYCGDCLESI